MMNKRQITFFTLLLATVHGYAQQRVIQGTVKDKDNKQKLEEVNIRYQRGIKHSHTAANGTFSVQPGMFPLIY